MSAPLVVNTVDGTVWTRREAVRDGAALYAPEKCGSCPQFVMATYAELEGHGIAGMADVLPVPVGPEPKASAGYPPALPWARLMDDEDLADFLDELAASAITHASNARALAEVEDTIARWRLIAEAQHGHNTAPGPDAVTRTFVPVASLREPEPEFHAYLHHENRVGHDLPKTGGPTSRCRCGHEEDLHDGACFATGCGCARLETGALR